MKENTIQEFAEACDKIGGEHYDKDRTHYCKLGNGGPSDGEETKEMELYENGSGSKDFSITARHRDKDGTTSGFINGDAEEIEIVSGLEGIYTGKMVVKNNEAETKVRMTNTTETKPHPKHSWGSD